MRDPLAAEAIEAALRTRYVGRPFTHLESVNSTQDLVAAAGARGESEGLAISTDEQSLGRGRFKRSWVSPLGGSILISILLRPPAEVLSSVVMIAALAVRDAIADAAPDLTPEIKWPNDILLNRRKTCGILVETTREGPEGTFSVLGIGMNVNWDTALAPEIADTATSLGQETGRFVPRASVLIPLLDNIEALYEAAKAGDDILGRWKARLVTLGRAVVVEGGDTEIQGVAEDVDASGALLVRDASGATHTVRAGDVTLSG